MLDLTEQLEDLRKLLNLNNEHQDIGKVWRILISSLQQYSGIYNLLMGKNGIQLWCPKCHAQDEAKYVDTIQQNIVVSQDCQLQLRFNSSENLTEINRNCTSEGCNSSIWIEVIELFCL